MPSYHTKKAERRHTVTVTQQSISLTSVGFWRRYRYAAGCLSNFVYFNYCLFSNSHCSYVHWCAAGWPVNPPTASVSFGWSTFTSFCSLYCSHWQHGQSIYEKIKNCSHLFCLNSTRLSSMVDGHKHTNAVKGTYDNARCIVILRYISYFDCMHQQIAS